MTNEPAELQLWINENGHFFIDRVFDIQVGQTWKNDDGSWTVEVNDQFLSAPDLEAAKRLFVDLYDRSQVVPSPGAEPDEEADDDEGYAEDETELDHGPDSEEGFEIINLP